MAEYQRRVGSDVIVVTVHQDENEMAALLRLAELGVRLPTLQDGSRRMAAALHVPNVMPATVVLDSDGSVAKTLPRAFATADEITDAVGVPAGCTKGAPVSGGGTPQRLDRSGESDLLTPELCPSWLRPLVDNIAEIPDTYQRRLPADVLAMVTASKKLTRQQRPRRGGAGAVLRAVGARVTQRRSGFAS